MALTHQIAYSKKLKKAKASQEGDVIVQDRPKVGATGKTRTASPLPTPEPAPAGKGPPKKPPAEVAAAGPETPDGSKLAPPFLTQVDFDTLAWLEERRKALGLRSRAEVIRATLTKARTGK